MNNKLRITKRLYDWCVLNKEPVPRIFKKSHMYYWIDVDDKPKMDSILLWADCLFYQSSDRKVKGSASSLKKAYGKYISMQNLI
jgi:hypothetical protein